MYEEALASLKTLSNVYGMDGEFRWKSTAAITSLTFTANTAFKDNSVFTLYGVL